MIYNYINKTNQELNTNIFENANNAGNSVEINKSKKYGDLLCLGSFVNTNIYTFTKKFQEKAQDIALSNNLQLNINKGINNNYNKNKKNANTKNKDKNKEINTYNHNKGNNFNNNINNSTNTNSYNKPKVKYLVKLIKSLCKIFKNYSYEFFIYHIYSKAGMNKNLLPQEMQIIRAFFMKENNLKELDLYSKSRISKSNGVDNKNFTNTNSRIDLESLEKKLTYKNKTEANQKNLNNINNNNSKNKINNNPNTINSSAFKNDSVEFDLDKNLFMNNKVILNQNNYNTNNNYIIDISSNNELTNNTIYDSLQSDKYQHAIAADKNLIVKESNNKLIVNRNPESLKRGNSSSNANNNNEIGKVKNYITSSNKFSSLEFDYNKNLFKKNVVNQNKFSLNKISSELLTKNPKLQSAVIKFISPNSEAKKTDMSNFKYVKDYKNDTLESYENNNTKNGIIKNFDKNENNNNDNNNKKEGSSFFNKNLLDSSLIFNSDASKLGINNYSINLNLKNNNMDNTNAKNYRNNNNNLVDEFILNTNSVLQSNTKTIDNFNNYKNSNNNTIKKSILSTINKSNNISNYNINSTFKKLDEKFSMRINNANITAETKAKATQPVNNFNNRINSNKLNLNFLSSLGSSKNNNSRGLLNNHSSSNLGFLNQNYFLKAKAELTHSEKNIKIMDSNYSYDANNLQNANDTVNENFNNNTVELNLKTNQYEEDYYSTHVLNTDMNENNLAVDNRRKNLKLEDLNSSTNNNANANDKQQSASNKIPNNNINNNKINNTISNIGANNNLKGSDNNTFSTLNNNLRLLSKNRIPLNKSKGTELDVNNYTSVRNSSNFNSSNKVLNTKEDNNNKVNTTDKKPLCANSRKNLFKKVDKKDNLNNNNEKIIQNNLNKNIKNPNSFSAACNRNFITDDIFNLRRSFNSFNKSVKNDFNYNSNTNNSNIFVVSRDNGSRFKTDFEDSDDSDIESNLNAISKNKHIIEHDGEGSNFNTPTKKTILRYYS